MLRILDSVRISRKLPTLMLALTLAAILGMGYISFRTAGDIIKTEAQERLTSLAESKAQAVQTFFGTIANNLIINAGDSITAEALISFSDVFERLENPMTDLQRVYIDETQIRLVKKTFLWTQISIIPTHVCTRAITSISTEFSNPMGITMSFSSILWAILSILFSKNAITPPI